MGLCAQLLCPSFTSSTMCQEMPTRYSGIEPLNYSVLYFLRCRLVFGQYTAAPIFSIPWLRETATDFLLRATLLVSMPV